MHRYVAFLRAINVGGRRVTNDQLCRVISAAGYGKATAYQAAGNLVVDTPVADPEALAVLLAEALESELGYAVPTVIRTGEQIRMVLEAKPFSAAAIDTSTGKPQVAFLLDTPAPKAAAAATALSTDADQLVVEGNHVFWLPARGVGNSDLDMAELARAVGPLTVRTIGTVDRIARKFFG